MEPIGPGSAPGDDGLLGWISALGRGCDSLCQGAACRAGTPLPASASLPLALAGDAGFDLAVGGAGVTGEAARGNRVDEGGGDEGALDGDGLVQAERRQGWFGRLAAFAPPSPGTPRCASPSAGALRWASSPTAELDLGRREGGRRHRRPSAMTERAPLPGSVPRGRRAGALEHPVASTETRVGELAATYRRLRRRLLRFLSRRSRLGPARAGGANERTSDSARRAISRRSRRIAGQSGCAGSRVRAFISR